MRIDVITLFPRWLAQLEEHGVVGRGIRAGKPALHSWNPRAYSADHNHRVDERPFGGGPGMVLQAAPLQRTLAAIRAVRADTAGQAPLIMLSPRGQVFDQHWARALAARPEGFILLCGRYEGIDQRFVDDFVDVQLSAGDFVLSGGELPAMMIIDAVARLLPGVLGDSASAQTDSFSQGLLEHPHYTRPADADVPQVLLSGDHAAIARWREQQALGWTWLQRPELLRDLALSDEQRALLRRFIAGERGKAEKKPPPDGKN
ncbi:MAG TPA: tRNA (guanosine(37)-N1)-methyltransferase TrmD [Salinisphaeraceae bacterium]|nr:tRNA (guanosine(37)-N1)-methyltransferase TrmD [Salinisphaeraceae bacterium]